MSMRLFVIVLLTMVVIGFTGCGSEPAPIAPDPKIPLSKVSADGTIDPNVPTPAPVTTSPASADASDDEEDEE